MLNAVKRLISLSALTFSLGLMFMQSPPLMADDTDIYLDPSVPTGAEPLVMFTLDYRANMSATQCNVTAGTDAVTIASIVSSCGYSSSFATELADLSLAQDGRIDLFDAIIGVLKLVLEPLSGLKVGLMMPHENTTAGGGCAPGDVECSSGAMVMMGFNTLVENDTNGVKERFIDIMKSIPSTDQVAGLPDYHPYQLKEMYFEFFRYLTGQEIFYGHQGWQDFDDSTGCGGANNGVAPCNPNRPDEVNLDGNNSSNNSNIGGMPVHAALYNNNAFDFLAPGDNYPMWDNTTQSTVTSSAAAVEDENSTLDAFGNPTEYVSPLAGVQACGKIYTINIGFGTANGDDDADTAMAASAASGGMGLTVSGSNTQAQVVQFLNDVDLADGSDGFARDTSGNLIDIDGFQNVISYFVMQSANNTQDQWAAAGGTGSAIELGSDPDVIIETLENIFNSILSVSTTFVAPSVPVNVFNRTQAANELFLALFQADDDGLPLWPGNIKKLALGEATDGSFELQDANGVQAIDIDGRIKRSAFTLWTTEDASADPNGNLDDVTDDANADVDGRDVKRGGVGQQMPNFLYTTTRDDTSVGDENSDTGARQLFTESSGSFLALDVDETQITDIVGLGTPAPTLSYTVTAAANPTLCTIWDDITDEWDSPPLQSDDITLATSCNDARDEDLARARDILLWARGREYVDLDNLDIQYAGGLITALNVDIQPVNRTWIMADPLHSRPLTINYGERGAYDDGDPLSDNSDIRIFAGTNDGFFHMFRNTNSDGSQSGEETWAFAPREVISKWQLLFDNVAQTEPVHPILADGSAIALVSDDDQDGTINTAAQSAEVGDADDFVHIFFGLRRGGKCMYAIDATNPDAPTFMWKTCRGDTGFEDLAQTWSLPDIEQITVDPDNDPLTNNSTLLDVLVIGGGYNGDDEGDNIDDEDLTDSTVEIGKDLANRDTNLITTTSSASGDVINDPVTRAPQTPSAIGTDDDEVGDGNVIYIINAADGSLVWKATRDSTFSGYDASTKTLRIPEMVDSIPSEIGAFDTNGDGELDRILAGDTGGRIWRIDLPGDDSSTWTATILLNAGRHFSGANVQADASTCTANTDKSCDRRFFNRPDLVRTTDGLSNFDAVLIGSGDREDPNDMTVDNFFYLVKDTATAVGGAVTTLDHDDLPDISSPDCTQDVTNGGCGSPDLTNGWRLHLENTGEKALSRSLTAGGVVLFSTFSPGGSVSQCDLNEGTGQLYAVNLLDATAVFNYNVANDVGGVVYDRSDTLEAGGIPVETVPLGEGLVITMGQAPGGGGGDTANIGGTIVNLDEGAGGLIYSIPTNTYWRTYWYERDADD